MWRENSRKACSAKLSGALFLVAIPWLLAGCAGVGVVATSDPHVKLSEAYYLYTYQGRALIAERLIWEAMEIFRERQDFHGLGHAHREYADLLLSSSIARWEKVFREDGFRDSTVTFENRFEKAKEYYARALETYRRAEPSLKTDETYDALTNLYYNMSWTSFQLGETEEACGFIEKSLDAYAMNIAQNPEAEPHIPPGYDSFESLILESPMNKPCS